VTRYTVIIYYNDNRHRLTYHRIMIYLIILCATFITEMATTCNCWSTNPVPQQKWKTNNACCSDRRQVFESLLLPLALVTTSNIAPASARNLPSSTGADESKTGTVTSLKGIVSLRYSLSRLEGKRYQKNMNYLDGVTIPSDEQSFKRIFDSYSDSVSYKQKFIDQNAFLVYYTKGFDGPGRPNIEEDNNERQTLQYGFRNDAWICWDNVLTELKFIDDDDDGELLKYITATIRAVDSYLRLAPTEDVKAVQQILGVSW